jgi:stage V sporulation protein G
MTEKKPTNKRSSKMKISNINLTLNRNENSKRIAFGSITMDKVLVITGVSVFKSEKGEFVKLPQYKKASGEYMDVTFPTTSELRKQINEAVLAKFEELKNSKN